MRRRDWLGGSLAAGLLAGSARRGWSQRPDRPNVLLAISDDQSWCSTSRAGDPVVRTPAFDRVAAAGVWCPHCFTSAPSCTASRAALLTGRHAGSLCEGANLWGTLPRRFASYPDLLEAAGYQVAAFSKAWSPGNFAPGGWTRNPAGPNLGALPKFLRERDSSKPFCFWLGTTDPHRPYELGSGVAAGLAPDRVAVPAHLPDNAVTRRDLCDYAHEIHRWDRALAEALTALEAAGELDRTIVIVTSDNGMPFPRSKANCYDYGTRQPLAICWPGSIPAGRQIDDFLSFTDLAPTILAACGVAAPVAQHTGRSLLPLLTAAGSGRLDPTRDQVITCRERHADVRAGHVGYPVRAVRTADWLYLRNYAPDRWPAGDAPGFGDIDGGPTQNWLLEHRTDHSAAALFAAACERRPAEELYDLRQDPDQLRNLAGDPTHQAELARQRQRLQASLTRLGDPRAEGAAAVDFDRFDYYLGDGRPKDLSKP
ncbi:MAG: sulfatase [Fimbriimonadaceae bacterium]|nr:sulfatase [Fimbriimonadaceae bacterium]